MPMDETMPLSACMGVSSTTAHLCYCSINCAAAEKKVFQYLIDTLGSSNHRF